MGSDNGLRTLTEPKMQPLASTSFVRFVFKPLKDLPADVFQFFDAFLKLIFANVI